MLCGKHPFDQGDEHPSIERLFQEVDAALAIEQTPNDALIVAGHDDHLAAGIDFPHRPDEGNPIHAAPLNVCDEKIDRIRLEQIEGRCTIRRIDDFLPLRPNIIWMLRLVASSSSISSRVWTVSICFIWSGLRGRVKRHRTLLMEP